MAVRKFQRATGGTIGGTYTCVECGKRTRETGQCESNCDLCAACYEEMGWRNHHSDTHTDEHDNGVSHEDCPKCEAEGYVKLGAWKPA